MRANESIEQMIIDAGETVGFELAHVELIRHGSSAVYRALESSNRVICVRVQSSSAECETAERSIHYANVFIEGGVSAVRPLCLYPVQLVGAPIITFWQHLENIQPVNLFQLGEEAKKIHEPFLMDHFFDKRRFNPFPRLELLFAAAKAADLPGIELDPLRSEMNSLQSEWKYFSEEVATTRTIHGDLHASNAIQLERPHLLDFDDSGYGPTEYDLIPVFARVKRYGFAAANYFEFCAGYGMSEDETIAFYETDLAKYFVNVRELLMILWLFGLPHSKRVTSEIALRLRKFTDEPEVLWTVLP